LVLLLALLALACSDGRTCGADTHEVDGACVPDVVCGPDTHEVHGTCAPDIVCGPDTHEVDGACAPDIVCGPDTHEVDGACAPDIVCGAGTMPMAGSCVPSSMLMCGPGTVQVINECVIDATECPPGSISRGDFCVPAGTVFVELPFEAGTSHAISQGMHGGFSHSGNATHALDFACPEGTTVVAARDGVVVGVKEDSNTGCDDPMCADQGNFVRVDHGDGTYASYYHLRRDGALVALGDRVCAGEPIARSGNTGFSSGPHLHFQVVDALGVSLPLYFAELGDATDGAAFAGVSVASANAPPATCDHAIAPADCQPDLFAHDGVLELEGLPCGLANRDVDYIVTGRVAGPVQRVYWATRGDLAGDWTGSCADTASDGMFSIRVRFASSHTSRRSYVTVAMALTETGGCSDWDGWDASPLVSMR
jgi:hypothetical protein